MNRPKLRPCSCAALFPVYYYSIRDCIYRSRRSRQACASRKVFWQRSRCASRSRLIASSSSRRATFSASCLAMASSRLAFALWSSYISLMTSRRSPPRLFSFAFSSTTRECFLSRSLRSDWTSCIFSCRSRIVLFLVASWSFNRANSASLARELDLGCEPLAIGGSFSRTLWTGLLLPFSYAVMI